MTTTRGPLPFCAISNIVVRPGGPYTPEGKRFRDSKPGGARGLLLGYVQRQPDCLPGWPMIGFSHLGVFALLRRPGASVPNEESTCILMICFELQWSVRLP